MIRAYRAEAAGVECIVAAETRGKAIAMTRKSAAEAGYAVNFQSVRAWRAPEWDEWAARDTTGRCWDEAFLTTAMGRRMTGAKQ